MIGDAADLGRAQSMRREHDRVFGELDDVDLLAAQFADDRLHAHALHADAGADAVHVAVAAMTAILVRSPASRAQPRSITVPS